MFCVFLKKHWNMSSKSISVFVCVPLEVSEVWVNWHIKFNAQHLVLFQRWTLNNLREDQTSVAVPYPDEIRCLQYTIVMSAIWHQLSSESQTQLLKWNMNSPIWYRSLVFHCSSHRLGGGNLYFSCLPQECKLQPEVAIRDLNLNAKLRIRAGTQI